VNLISGRTARCLQCRLLPGTNPRSLAEAISHASASLRLWGDYTGRNGGFWRTTARQRRSVGLAGQQSCSSVCQGAAGSPTTAELQQSYSIAMGYYSTARGCRKKPAAGIAGAGAGASADPSGSPGGRGGRGPNPAKEPPGGG
jgi:hypothetical protein